MFLKYSIDILYQIFCKNSIDSPQQIKIIIDDASGSWSRSASPPSSIIPAQCPPASCTSSKASEPHWQDQSRWWSRDRSQGRCSSSSSPADKQWFCCKINIYLFFQEKLQALLFTTQNQSLVQTKVPQAWQVWQCQIRKLGASALSWPSPLSSWSRSSWSSSLSSSWGTLWMIPLWCR